MGEPCLCAAIGNVAVSDPGKDPAAFLGAGSLRIATAIGVELVSEYLDVGKRREESVCPTALCEGGAQSSEGAQRRPPLQTRSEARH
ncbi:hypothetical protein D3C71_315370 [compost metagenome]